jgi:hypothetical protein
MANNVTAPQIMRSTYAKVLGFYCKIAEIMDLPEEDELPHDLAMAAIDLFNEAKGEISIPTFTAEQANELHDDFDVRETYAEAAFEDLAQHLRDPQAQEVMKKLIINTGLTGGDDLFVHMKNARLLGKDTRAAVITLVVDDLDMFKRLMSKDENERPSHVHGSISDKVADMDSENS